MKNLLLSLLIFFSSGLFAQKIIKTEKVTDHSTHILGDDFEGVIFHENYFQHPNDSSEIKIKRFTPSNEDILLLESVLKKQIKNKQYKGDKKYIFANLKEYKRQYIGYFNDKGEKLIYVNCFPIDEDWAMQKAKEGGKTLKIPKWYTNLFQVFDGGKSFWQAHVNLNMKKIIDMSVNGVA
jgi:hypothetical protein